MEEFLCLFLDEFDEELPVLLPSISGRQYASAALEVEEQCLSLARLRWEVKALWCESRLCGASIISFLR